MISEAMVQVGDEKLEHQELPVPDVAPDEALLRVEAAGICGSDHDQFLGDYVRTGWASYPVIPGHETVGRIVAMGAEASRLWTVSEGDMVAVEAVVPCHVCENCLRGYPAFCQHRFQYGLTPTTVGCGLWGGFSQYMVLRPNTVVHKIPEGISAEIASLFNPLGAGFDWAVRRAGTMAGDVVVVFGAGQRGLGCVVAAKSAGASRVVVTGLSRDKHKLELARKLGADAAIDIEQADDLRAAVLEGTNGQAPDRVIDTTPLAAGPVVDAVELVRPGGVVVIAGVKGAATIPQLPIDRVTLKAIDVRGVTSVSVWARAQALRVIAEGTVPVALIHTHTLGLDAVLEGINLLSTSEAIHIAIKP
jgi:threonine dehydrogenase-like Zn-dependent dehydrogenase